MVLVTLSLYWSGFNSGVVEEKCKKQLEELVRMFSGI